MQSALGRGKALSAAQVDPEEAMTDHTPCNWTANPSLRRDLGGRSRSATRPNWQQPKCLSAEERLNSAMFIQHMHNSPVFPPVPLRPICSRATNDPILANT